MAAQGCGPGRGQSSWGKATPTPEQQHEAARGQVRLAPWERLAATLKARWSHPRTLTEREKKTGLLISGSALPSICVVPSLPLFLLPPSPLLPIYSSLGQRLETYIQNRGIFYENVYLVSFLEYNI